MDSPERGLRKGEPLPPLLVSLRSLIGDLPYKYMTIMDQKVQAQMLKA